MSRWAHNPEFFDERLAEMCLAGDFGPELQSKVLNGDVYNWELWALLTPEQSIEATREADLAWFDRQVDAADHRTKAERENG